MNTFIRNGVVVLALGAVCFAQTAATSGTTTKRKTTKTTTRTRTTTKAPAVTEQDIQQLKDMLQQQQQQIQQMQRQMAQRDQQLAEAQAAAREAQSNTTLLETAATEQKETTNKLASDVSDLKMVQTNAASTLQETQKDIAEKVNSPAAIHYRGITLTPGGFIEAAGMWRQRAEQNDVISSFNGIPYSGSPQGHLTEFRGTARQSRMSVLAEGKVGHTKLTGYWEMDFLGAAPTANENQSTSFNIRQRQLFAQAAMDSGWTFTAGQTWSLITLNKKGIEARGEWLPATIDAQYMPGYDFARLMTARVTKTFADKKATVAFSVENPATLFGGMGTPSYVVTTLPGTGSLGNGANYSVNLAPDVLAKVAFDPGWGHYEIKGVGRFFRDRVVANGTTIPGGNNTKVGGGIGFGAILPVVPKKVDIIAQGLMGNGVARYTDSSNVDVIIRPDGAVSPVRSYSGLAGIETHPNSKFDWYVYGGGEYLGRNAGSMTDLTGTVKQFGYGNPTLNLSGCYAPESSFSCSANFKNLVQGTTGMYYRFYKGPYGTLQYGLQLSYTHKGTWTGVNGLTSVNPSANETIVMTNFRYYIP